MIIVTGGAGFIGSAIVEALNRRGHRDLIIVDELDHLEKEHNFSHLSCSERIGIAEFRTRLKAGEFDDEYVEAILHLGACSSTLETNWDYLLDNNVEYTKDIISWCTKRGLRCVYASSAATYGDGENGYSDAHELFDELVPLNLYGKSKLDVDLWARNEGHLDSVVGLRYFNVYGPNEFHKAGMMSVVAKKYPGVARGNGIELFRSYKPEYQDGGQLRDFIYVKDVVDMTLYFLDTPTLAGVFNVGTGKAESWNAVAKALFIACDMPEDIRYIDMPDALKNQYQYFTQADMKKLESAGWDGTPTPLHDAITDYVRNYLAPHKHLDEA